MERNIPAPMRDQFDIEPVEGGHRITAKTSAAIDLLTVLHEQTLPRAN